jgi:CheY-like chemotaxis protein
MQKKISHFILADDDEDDTSLFAEALSEIDPMIRFDCYSNGKELLENIKDSHINGSIIFLDINMPEMNGWETIKRLKASPITQEIPVFIYSTSYSIPDGNQALQLGALCFYEKPSSYFKLKDFLQVIADSSIDTLKPVLEEISDKNEHKVFTI